MSSSINELDSNLHILEYGDLYNDMSKINQLDSLELIFIKYDSIYNLSSDIQLPTHYSLITIPLEDHAVIDYQEPKTELKYSDNTSGYFEFSGDSISYISEYAFYGIDTTRAIKDNHVFYYDTYPFHYDFDIDQLGFYKYNSEVSYRDFRALQLNYNLNKSPSDKPQVSLRKVNTPSFLRGYHIPYIIFKYDDLFYSIKHSQFSKSKTPPLSSNLIVSNEENFLKHTPKLKLIRTEITKNDTSFHFNDSIPIHHEDILYCYKGNDNSIKVRDLKYDLEFNTTSPKGNRCKGSFKHLDSEDIEIEIHYDSQIFDTNPRISNFSPYH